MKLITDEKELLRIDSSDETLKQWEEVLIGITEAYITAGIKGMDYIRGNMFPYKNKEISLPDGTKFDRRTGRIIYSLSKEDIWEIVNENQYSNYMEDKPNFEALYEKETDDKKRSLLNSKYLIISLNPTDKLMCSTNNLFSSCLSMDSTDKYGYGLPAIFPAEGIFTVFLTKGKHEKWNGLRNFKMNTRSFLYQTEGDQFVLGKQYGSSLLDMDTILKKIGIETVSKREVSVNRKENWVKNSIIKMTLDEKYGKNACRIKPVCTAGRSIQSNRLRRHNNSDKTA